MLNTITSDYSIKLSEIRAEIAQLQPQLVHWRRKLHQYPELGFEEVLTADFVAEKLSDWGIDYQTQVAKTGIVATIQSHYPGKVLGIRADMDALPIQEENNVSYCSKHKGIMHGCGHDGHTAIALGIAYYLAHNRDKWQGTVKVIFQPAEEGPGGAKPMIEAGVLINPSIDAIIGLHLWNNLPVGTIGVREGALMAAVECFKCTLFGKGGHGAMPDQTIDSVLLGAQIINSLQTIVSRNVSPIDSAVVTVGQFQGGTALNVIADTAKMSGTVRYFNPKLEKFIEKRIETIIKGICESHGAKYDLDYWQLYPPVINHPRITQLVKSVALEVVETPLGVVPECQTMGGEDMSFFLQQVPGCYFFLGSANVKKGLNYPHHHPRFDFDETVLSLGVEIFARCVEKFADFII
ncbi:M20 family metallopeptidase [Geminocystis sp. NIES-3709]|uniref:M20 metallopeptidase family protein n=1 Tax=Geminocystis sp. NIES-3709 TaxID=1617448 RepID=UPI0005FC55C7|nr:M20 family metallopeptidase [Geminocystis sp. NIES-3709]BAQ66010.1 N-acetyl-L,L-diaminopimelate deacetylase homolog [Geminocystis sp. NIES-3709]